MLPLLLLLVFLELVACVALSFPIGIVFAPAVAPAIVTVITIAIATIAVVTSASVDLIGSSASAY